MAGTKRSRSVSVSRSGMRPYKRRKAASRPSNTLGRVTGRVGAASTTLARSAGPFTGKKLVTFLYENALRTAANATPLIVMSTKCNSAYDYDNGGYFGNKQPLYYDSLLTAAGPYRQYKVKSWKTTYTIINTTDNPITVWAIPPTSAAAEVDTVVEVDNWPGVKRLYLTAKAGSQSKGTITVTGNIADVYPDLQQDAGMVGGYGGDPASLVYGGLVVETADGSTSAVVDVAVKHEMFTELQMLDSIVS